MNKTANKSGELPPPIQVTLTNKGSTPLMAIGAILSLDYLLLEGSIVSADYDLIGQLMLGSIFVSGLIVARCLFQNKRAAKIDAFEASEMSA
jgi:hypothetical protein